MGYGSRSAKGHQIPLLDEICAYLDDLFRPILEEEMGNLATYARCASAALASSASGHWEAFWFDWNYAENLWMEERICYLKLMRDMYLHEENEASSYLFRVKNVLLPLNFVGPPSN